MVAHLLPELVHAPLGQLLPHFDGRLPYGLWCWLGILEVCSLAKFIHVVSAREKEKTMLVQEGIIQRFSGYILKSIRLKWDSRLLKRMSKLRGAFHERPHKYMHSSGLPPMAGASYSTASAL